MIGGIKTDPELRTDLLQIYTQRYKYVMDLTQVGASKRTQGTERGQPEPWGKTARQEKETAPNATTPPSVTAARRVPCDELLSCAASCTCHRNRRGFGLQGIGRWRPIPSFAAALVSTVPSARCLLLLSGGKQGHP